MKIEDSYTAFCFDEAVDFITEQWDYEKNKWKVRPKWIDEPLPNNNNKLIEYIKKHSI